MGSRSLSATLPIIALWVLSACSDPTGGGAEWHPPPDLETLPGRYRARLLRIDLGDGPVDVIPTSEAGDGSWFDLKLREDGTTYGSIEILIDGEAVVEDTDLEGTWTVDDWAIVIDHPGHSFVEDLRFHQSGDTLAAQGTTSGMAVEVTLTKVVWQDPTVACGTVWDLAADSVALILDAVYTNFADYTVRNLTADTIYVMGGEYGPGLRLERWTDSLWEDVTGHYLPPRAVAWTIPPLRCLSRWTSLSGHTTAPSPGRYRLVLLYSVVAPTRSAENRAVSASFDIH